MDELQYIKNIMVHGESERVEFKSSFNDEALETIGSFSNSNGGSLIVGVNDDGQSTGLQLGKKSLEDIANRVQAVTDPRIQPSINVYTVDNSNIILIKVSASLGTPVSVRGRFFKRVGKTNQRMSQSEIMSRLIKGFGKHWDGMAFDEYKFQDLDLGQLEKFRTLSNNIGRKIIPKSTSDTVLLEKLNLMCDNKLTRASVLLFGGRIAPFFPSAFIKIGRFRSPTMIVDDKQITGTLPEQLDEVMSWFRSKLSTEFVITGEPQREVIWEYPLEAIREAVINMLCHRDYSNIAHSQIRVYDDRIEFWNAGSLPVDLSVESLFVEHNSYPRNPLIATIFSYLGLVEEWGSGTVRIVDELVQAGLPKPEFISESGRFKVIFYKDHSGDNSFAQLDLTEKQLHIFKLFEQKNIGLKSSDISATLDMPERTVRRYLNELLDLGLVRIVGKGYNTTWFKK